MIGLLGMEGGLTANNVLGMKSGLTVDKVIGLDESKDISTNAMLGSSEPTVDVALLSIGLQENHRWIGSLQIHNQYHQKNFPLDPR